MPFKIDTTFSVCWESHSVPQERYDHVNSWSLPHGCLNLSGKFGGTASISHLGSKVSLSGRLKLRQGWRYENVIPRKWEMHLPICNHSYWTLTGSFCGPAIDTSVFRWVTVASLHPPSPWKNTLWPPVNRWEMTGLVTQVLCLSLTL